jgi:hypothetical protein
MTNTFEKRFHSFNSPGRSRWGQLDSGGCRTGCKKSRSRRRAVRYHVVRGTLDASGAIGPSSTNKANRNRKRSKYGVKRPKA